MDWRDIWAGDQEEGGCVWVYDLRVGEDECAKSGAATYLGSGRGEAAWERLGLAGDGIDVRRDTGGDCANQKEGSG